MKHNFQNWMKGKGMETIKIRQNEEFIKLGQALKAIGAVESGVEAKEVVQERLIPDEEESYMTEIWLNSMVFK